LKRADASRPAVLAVGAFAAALLVRSIALWVVRLDVEPQVWEYHEIAQNLLRGVGFVYERFGIPYFSFVEPLYPFLVAGLFFVTGKSYLALALVQIVVSALLAPVVFVATRYLAGTRAAVLAAGLTIIHPGFVAYSLKDHPLVLDSLLMALVLVGFLALNARPDGRTGVWLGLALGACLLSRPTVLVIVPVAVAWVLMNPEVRKRARPLVLAGVVAVLIVSPWLIRNYSIHGTVLLGRSNVGYMLWIGNNPAATGSMWRRGTPVADRLPPALRASVLAQHDELSQDRMFWQAARDYIVENPGAMVDRMAKKFWYFWWFSPGAGRQYAAWAFGLYQAWHVLLVAIASRGVAGALMRTAGADARVATLIVAFPLLIGLLQSVFFVETRYRLAMEWSLLGFGGLGLRLLALDVGRVSAPSMTARG
jgi:4-amino-4-deoxy-L-arabinose transferase-like glycosyltransferase